MPGHQVSSTEKMGECFTDLANRQEEVNRRCRPCFRLAQQNRPAAPKSILPAPQM